MLLCSVALHAQAMDIRPLDFQPLTSLPWKTDPKASLDQQLERIFLESDPDIRYPVLAAFLRRIPAGDLEAAFDVCLQLEGTQCPQGLVAFFLPIWSERDPHGAWKRVEPLFSDSRTPLAQLRPVGMGKDRFPQSQGDAGVYVLDGSTMARKLSRRP